MEITTKRARINPISESDISEVIEMYKEPDSFKFISPLLDKDDDFYDKFLRSKIEANKIAHSFWAVRCVESNELIGTVNLNNFKDSDIIHIGSHLSVKYWNKGFSTELLAAIIDFGFNTRGLNSIFGIMSPEHVVSKKLLMKLGFEFHKKFDNDGETLHLYRLVK